MLIGRMKQVSNTSINLNNYLSNVQKANQMVPRTMHSTSQIHVQDSKARKTLPYPDAIFVKIKIG